MYQLILILSVLSEINADTYSVKINTDNYVNIIDDKFLSFTIDPKYLFSSSEKYRSKECLCMASSLSPAYIRIAGPSTAQLSFHNATIAIDEDSAEVETVSFHDDFADTLAKEFRGRVGENRFKRNQDKIGVSHKEWRKFVQWASTNNFELIFALNNEERTSSGLWDPNTALNILTVAENVVEDIYWQLGYECKNQSIEEYLNDLETLRVITETFPPGRAGRWRVVGGDVTGCLHADSKSDFKDYILLSDDMMDAILLNGNSSTRELERMSPRDRRKLLRVLSASSTPLWLTEPAPALDQLTDAVDWLTGLGHAARNGFSSHFRELGDQMYQPSLSFYMALLFKNLVGSRVLSAEMEPEQAILFAHCTSLRHRPVPGAVTLYAANLQHEAARFSVRLGAMEEGGDILQFVLGMDANGNIQVNGRPMYFEGDLKPVVKRVRPYKTLVINLPPKSFGFWVLANTKVKACFEEKKEDDHTIETLSESVEDDIKIKRSVNDFEEHRTLSEDVDFFDSEETAEISDENIISKMNNLNHVLNNVQDLFKEKENKRTKRSIEDKISDIRNKLRRRGIALRNYKRMDSEEKPAGIIGNLFQLNRRNLTRNFKNNRRSARYSKNKVTKRNPQMKNNKIKSRLNEETKLKVRKVEPKHTMEKDNEEKLRARRSINNNKVIHSEDSAENEIGDTPADKAKLWKILKSIHKELKDLSEENDDYIEEDTKSDSQEGLFDNETGIIKNTVGNLMKVLSDLNKNLHRVWDAINVLD